jgi:threonine dehydrogenase-like Zn-dependent dehydrogenase
VLSFRIENRKLKNVSQPMPKLQAGWALVRVRMVGICNTDVELLHGYYDFRGVPGHEFVGTVEELRGVSAAERKKWMGRQVCGEINISCAGLGRSTVCDFCRRGLKMHCSHRMVLGILGHPGAFAEYLTLPLENLHLMANGVSDELAVFVEPLAAACEILEQVDAKKFREAAVLGDGKLAQLIAMVLRTAIPRVVMFGKHEKKLALARRAGIVTRKVRGNASDLKNVKEQYRLVVEATGSATGFALAVQMTEARGTLVLKSTFHGAAPVETWPMVVKEMTMVGSRCGPFEKAIALLRSGKVDPRPLITRTFPLREATKAMTFAQKRGVMKVLLKV